MMITVSKAERYERQEELHRLCASIVDDPHSANADTVAAFKSAVRRFLKSYPDLPEEEGLRRLFESQGELGDALREAVAVLPTSRVDDDDDADEIAKARNRDYVGAQGLGAAIMDHALDVLDHLRRRHGFSKTAKDAPMDSIHSIMKDAGIASVCAQIVQKGSTSISEQEIVEAVTKIAAERYPESSPAQAFSKVFSASTDEARILQKAVAIAKAMPFVMDDAPLMVGGEDAQNVADPSKAIAQLRQIGRDRWPTASEAQQFANAMTDPKNAVLAAKAHRRPSPTTSFEFPR